MSRTRLFISLASLTLLIIGKSQQCCGYRILGIFPLNSRSHMMMFEALMKGLVTQGHQVDVISVFPQKTPYPNYTDIIIPAALPKLINAVTFEDFRNIQKQTVFFIATNGGNSLCERNLNDPQIQRLIKTPPQNPPYDLVIVEFFGAHCFMAFGHHFKVPVVAVSTTTLYPWGNDLIANPENLAFVPNNLLQFRENMNFWERLYNYIHTVYSKLAFNHYTAIQDEIIQKHFGPGTPGVRDLERNVALMLVNTHFSINGVQPMTTALIEVGGIHIQDDGPDIPAEHMKWLDNSTDGFVYFTFGSLVVIETFPEFILQALYQSLAKIAPVRVFMKVPRPERLPPGLPKNIRTFSWIPQLKVLKHKNIRAYITHGGLMSTQEAISCAVPMIGVPLFADQFLNIEMFVRKKIAVRLDYMNMTEERLDLALNEILYNPIYRDTIKRVSSEFLDRPMSPTDTACYWIEYVIRHGHEALRSPAFDLTWWQVALLDVHVFILTIIVLAVITICNLVRFFIRTCSHSPITLSKKLN